MTMTNTNANKVTKLQKFEMLRNWIAEIENAAIDESIELTEGQPEELTMLIEFIDNEMELLRNKRAKAKSAQTKNQKENEGIKAKILEVLFVDTGMTATEVGNELGISVQKASALLNQMAKAGTIVKVIDKKKSLFALPEAETLDVEGDEADSEELETE